MLRLAIGQINPIVGDLDNNSQKILSFIDQAVENQVDIVAFPELAICGYPPEDLLHKNHFVENNIKCVKKMAKSISKTAAIIGFVDMDDKKRLYNAAAVIASGEIKGIYRKEELPNYGVFDEKRYFTAGTKNNIYALGYDYFSVNICEDIWGDNDICIKQSKQGASLLINISSSPFDITKQKEREKLIKKRAKETNSFISYVNLIGGQDELVFDGGSFVVDPKGKVLARAKRFEEDLVYLDLPLSKSRERKYKPFDIIELMQKKSKKEKVAIQTDISKDLDKISSIYKALVLGTKDYVLKNGFQKVLIGLSGGIDSALVAAIAVDALGSDNVIGVTMPSRYTSKGTKSDAIKLADQLGIKCKEVPIEDTFKSYLGMLEEEFKGCKPNIAEENIQARIRGNILMALSNKFGWLVLTTGNKSEVAVGYCTLYGDMSGGFAVIKDIAKTQVYELCEYINSIKGKVIPRSIINRPPSAELRDNQKDQDSLPPYEDLDYILEEYVEKHKSLASISKKIDKRVVMDIIRKVDLSEYKRRQAPPGIKITSRAFGKDWRLPITHRYKEK